MEEIYICTQHLKGVNYNDVLMMPTYERRFFLSLLTKDIREREEKFKEQQSTHQDNNAKGSRKRKISGEALKSQINNGTITNT